MTTASAFHCCDQRRRALVAAHPTLNGIDYLEVLDRDLPTFDAMRQRTLLIRCLKAAPAVTRDNVRIDGGERLRDVRIEWVAPAQPLPAELSLAGEAATKALVAALPDPDEVVVVRVSEPGDFSTYRIALHGPGGADDLLADFDPQLSAVDFLFKVDCPSDFDCVPACDCADDPGPEPDINYLAKDYQSFRRLLLDRMSQTAPDWRRSSVADYGVALVELLAYVGDHLSYRQDAIATEAYLDTARLRLSVRRHALLVDYPMHDGCNARAWVHVRVRNGSFTLNPTTQFLTTCRGFGPGIAAGSQDLNRALLLKPLVYEPLHAPTLRAAHNEIEFHAWGDARCCLPKGSTSATLKGPLPDLQVGDVLLFEEVRGPATGAEEDADPSRRHVVRLTARKPDAGGALTDPLTGDDVVEIFWADEDALPFPLCVSSVTDATHGLASLTNVSVARGNLVLVDLGRTIRGEDLGAAPEPFLTLATGSDCAGCDVEPAPTVPARYTPRLSAGPLTHAARLTVASGQTGEPKRMPFDPSAPAAAALDWSMADVLPEIALRGGGVDRWRTVRTLLKSSPNAADFVVETDDSGVARLRFGDDAHGRRPEARAAMEADYRVGNGTTGNVGAEAITHIVAAVGDLSEVVAVRNPMAASGGVDPEPVETVRRNAPEAFRRQERAVTTADYAEVAERRKEVQRAAATMRWTGSWHTMFVTVDPLSRFEPGPLKQDLARFFDRYRMAGHDLEFDDPRYVSLELGLHVCVEPDHFRSDVRRALTELFSDRAFPDGRRALFHPDNLAFGQTVYLGPLYAAAHRVPGVQSARFTTFQRQGTREVRYLLEGRMPIGRLEIPRLANSRNYPEHGVFALDIQGGK